MERPVESQPDAHSLYLLRRGVTVGGTARGIAGQDEGQRKDDEGDPEQHRDGEQQPLNDEPDHAARRSNVTPRPRSAANGAVGRRRARC